MKLVEQQDLEVALDEAMADGLRPVVIAAGRSEPFHHTSIRLSVD